MRMRASSFAIITCLLTGLIVATSAHSVEEEEFPERLSQWELFDQRDGELIPRDAMVYDLKTPLFSDYALKLRTIRVPKGMAIQAGNDELIFPLGTVISKTFYYPRGAPQASEGRSLVQKAEEAQQVESLNMSRVRLLETRLLIKTLVGWQALPYVWNADQSDATLEVAGESFALTLVQGRERTDFDYMVPDANQCSSCHGVNGTELKPIGLKVQHLNKNRAYGSRVQNQLAHWQQIGLLEGSIASAPATATWNDPRASLDARARAYLDVNCSHCHSAAGAANSSGLLLDRGDHDPVHLGICKPPVATGRASGNDSYSIVPGSPRKSIMVYRMQSTEPDIAMPELGRSLVHKEGVALISQWIKAMDGECAEMSK